MKHYKYHLSNFKISIITALALLLSGCMLLPPMQQKHQLEKTCQLSPVLLTNLTVPNSQRHYMLPNHQLCPSKSFV